jgi:hypothetical protein
VSWLSELIGGKDEQIQQVPTLSERQRKVEKPLAATIRQGISRGATPYSGQLTAAVPTFARDAFNTLSEQLNSYRSSINSALAGQIAGVPAYVFDPAGASRQWQEMYAAPVMETWKQTVLPALQESYNLPGVAYGTMRGRGVEQTANQFYGQQVAPTLFNWLQQGEQMGATSRENAAARQLTAMQMPLQLSSQLYAGVAGAANAAGQLMSLEQPALTAQYQEFMRTSPEANPWLGQALNYLGLPTTATLYKPEQPGILQAGLQQLIGGMTNNLTEWATGGGLAKQLGIGQPQQTLGA